MALHEYAFGELIELCIEENSSYLYNENHTIGVNIDKEIRIMRGNSSRKELQSFYLVKPDTFVYNPRGSRKLGLGYNDSLNTYITTFNNMVFQIKDSAREIILPHYLYMYLSRTEWDRKAEFLSWGSSTEVFSWDTFCETTITLPQLAVQQKYVNIYKSLLANQRAYERGLDDLRLTCDAYIDNLRKKMPAEKIGPYLIEIDWRNGLALSVDSVRGLATSKEIIPTKADMTGVNLSNYKTVLPRQIAYVPDTSRRGDKISLGLNNTDETFLVSSISIVFDTNREKLLPEYLMLFFTRPEFDKYARFHSWGSVREIFSFGDMRNVEIPIPDISVQKALADLYSVYTHRKAINERLKAQIKGMCPILIKGSAEEASE